ncbi:sensor histidine kinase [uncultured Thioclava sp.]|uniref:sensor histidine kinase n=1 Tax=uncultured Thioclava sp. TaxID=473858 RepID=UPI0025E275FE|nr:sensor histidine kinase [uncultured Thioclava sp.]
MSAVLWIEQSTRAELTRVLDARLVEAAQMVASLVSKNQIALNRDDPAQISLPASADYEHQQFCQIWSFSSGLVGRSTGAPREQMVPADATGFRTITRDDKALRVYTIVDPDLGGQVTVGDSLAIRDRLVRDVIAGFLWPAVVILPVMWGLIWLSITTGLAPLARFARDLEARRTDDLGALPESKQRPREIRPLAGALDDLLARLARARERERDFIAYAAHEMKTPLAGLKTQAHIARRAPDQATRARALEAISTSVDRTDRMVHQLLDLAQVESRETRSAPLELHALLRQVLADLTEVADRRTISLALEPPLRSLTLSSDPFLLTIALRNLIENAIQASPTGSDVLVKVSDTEARVLIDIRDGGPGLPPAIAGQAQEKFVKGNNVDPSGSGLGLAIATDAITAASGDIRFERRADGHHTIVALSRTRCHAVDRKTARDG